MIRIAAALLGALGFALIALFACSSRSIGDGHVVRCAGDRGAFVIQRDTLYFLGDTTEDGVWTCVMREDGR